MHYYEQSALWDRDLTPQEKDRIGLVQKIIPQDVETILDAGCGNGAISNYLEGYTIRGIDRSEEALKYFKHDKIIGSLESLPFEDGAFDLVLCSDVLEHLPKGVFEQAINELQRVSKKYLLIISPNAEDLEASNVKCSECSTIFNINWHLRSLGLDELTSAFSPNYTPFIYTYFGDKWANDPVQKYRLNHSSNTGYKSWDQAVCPLCHTQQKNCNEINNTSVDILLNRELNGFYNHSNEVMILFANTELKKSLYPTEILSKNDLWLMSEEKLSLLINNSRQAVDCTQVDVIQSVTTAYPQCAYLLQNENSHWVYDKNSYVIRNEVGQNRGIVCIPFTDSAHEIFIELYDDQFSTIRFNIYDLTLGYISLGDIALLGSGKLLHQNFTIPSELVPPNEGIMLEIITEEAEGSIRFKEIYIDNPCKILPLSEENQAFFANKSFHSYQIPLKQILINHMYYPDIPRDTYIFDYRCNAFFWNSSGSFEFFRSPMSTIKADFDLVNVLSTNKNELRISRKKIAKLQKFSLAWRFKQLLRNAYYAIKYPKITFTKEALHADPSRKHLVVLTPDVKIDRRTVQMCQSLIEHHDFRCTIIAALEGNDDFVGDHLIVKRIFPNDAVSYDKQKLAWQPGTRFDLETFYWLHSRYLSRALQEDADIMMCCDLPVLPAATYAAKIKNIPLIYDAHELYPEQAIFPNEKRELYSRVEQEFIRYPDLVITVNQSIACEMAKRYSIAEPSVILNALDAPEGFDIDYNYDYFREQIPISPEQKIVLFQGGYSPNRNLELFVASAKYLKRSDIVLVLMGFGIFQEELEGIARTDGTLKNSVFFFPAVDQSVLLEYSASADVGIIPYPHVDLNSFYCTPNKLFEFIQAGLPMIANDSPELNRFVRENEIGYSRKIETAEDIADMIDTYFAQNIDYATAMREAREKISWTVEERKFLTFFEKVI